jgi:DNA sulfur modification protein DndD
LEQLEARIGQIDVERVRLSAQLDDLLLQVADVDLELIVQNRQKLERSNKLLGALQSDMKPLVQKIASTEHEIAALSAAIAVAADPAARKISRRVEILQALVDVFGHGIGKLRDALRENVESHATKAFLSMTTEKTFKGLRINNRYGLNILDRNGEPLPLRSAGAEQIVALSLIDGLSKSSGKDAPLIMDTPFGRLDPRHRRNVLTHLPSMARQVILLVHEGEMDKQRDLSAIASTVAAAFEIRRQTPSQSKIVKI